METQDSATPPSPPPSAPPATPPEAPGASEMAFQAEVKQVLSLVIHSLYTHREVFLRELVSNASDALDKGRFLALTDESADKPEGELAIRIKLDEAKKTLTIEDDGVGMTRDEAISNLGTIARSGSAEFLKTMADKAKSDAQKLDLIGQFGVGFYAAFMVASRVDVSSKSMKKGEPPVLWRSSGDGTFMVLPGERDKPGTEIVLHLKEDAAEFARGWRVREVIEKYSDFVHFPIYLDGELVNKQKAIWAQPRSQVTDEQHTEFFRRVTGFETQTPLLRVHHSVDAPVQFHALLYVPEKAPLDLFRRENHGLRLYAKRVLIMEECEKILPSYLRFMRGVVDSEDLSLNVSREMLQEDRTLAQIEQQITKQSLKALKDLAESDPEKYAAFWGEFGRVLKEGIHSDWRNKDAIAELCRWESLKGEPGKLTSLKDYVAAMPEDQKEIFYVTGTSRRAVETSPHLEAFKKRGFDVLLMTDPIDEWVTRSLYEFDKRKLRSVAHGEIDLGDGGEDKGAEAKPGEVEEALAAVREVLGDRVKEVRASKRLTESASCLVAGEGEAGAHFERLMKAMEPGFKASKRVLELNPGHPVVKNLNELAKRDPKSDRVRIFAELLHDEALLAEGVVEDPAAVVRRMQSLMAEASEAALKT